MPSLPRRHQLHNSLIYHVFNRSNARVPIFHSDADFNHFIKLLGEYTMGFLLRIYHWAIMNNHFHLLLEIDEPEEISRFMAGLDRAYTHYHHRVYGTTGLLWQGRFKLQLVQKQTYLAACGRYIERNPVRADLVQAAHEYLYGSARYYCAGVPDGITTEDPTYSMTGLSHSQRQMRYMEFLRDFNADEEALFRNNEESVGDRRFVAQFHVVRGRLMPRRRGREVRIYRL